MLNKVINYVSGVVGVACAMTSIIFSMIYLYAKNHLLSGTYSLVNFIDAINNRTSMMNYYGTAAWVAAVAAIVAIFIWLITMFIKEARA